MAAYQIRRDKHPHGDGEVIARPLLAYVGRREVYDDIAVGILASALGDGEMDTLLALAHGCVGHAYHREHQSAVRCHFYGHRYGVNALQGGAIGLDKHGSRGGILGGLLFYASLERIHSNVKSGTTVDLASCRVGEDVVGGLSDVKVAYLQGCGTSGEQNA